MKKKVLITTWCILAILFVFLYYAITDFFIFPSKFEFPLFLFLVVIICITGIASLLAKGKVKTIVFVLNGIIILCVVFLIVLFPTIESRIKSIFSDQSVYTSVINVYVLKDNARSNIVDYQNSSFIIQKSSDLENQEYAIEEINNIFNKDIILIEKDDVISSARALLNKEGDLLILNDAYIELIEEFEGFENFSDRVKIVYSIERKAEEKNEKQLSERTDITNTPFTMLAAGCDTRSGRLSIYGRTDVNLLLTVNPNTRQILIVGIPRDSYIPNPAINDGDDKLTHLGNAGIYNSMAGISKYFDIEINYYGEVIFDTFKNIIDALGGIDIDNPYYFTTVGGNGSQFSKEYYSFEEGKIHLTGDSALAYCRERWNLPNGDYGRTEHLTYVLKGIMNKVTSNEVLDRYISIWDALKGQFLTDFDVEDIFSLINMQINDNSDWDIITYHLGGIGDMQGTASMGWNRKLYVVHLFDSQVGFIKEQIDLMMADKLIKQNELPQNDETTYIPN